MRTASDHRAPWLRSRLREVNARQQNLYSPPLVIVPRLKAGNESGQRDGYQTFTRGHRIHDPSAVQLHVQGALRMGRLLAG